MPRRPKKPLPDHLFQPGQSGNPNGRPVGSVSEINQKIKTSFAMLLAHQLPNLEKWLEEGAKRDPLKTADLMLRISERFLPSLQRTEITGKDGEAFTPITINIPTFHLPKREDTLEISEGTPTALPVLPGAETKVIGEGTPTEDRPEHYEHSQSAVSKEDEHYEHSDSAVSEPDSSEPAGEPSPDVDSFTFLPDLGKVSAPPGWKRD